MSRIMERVVQDLELHSDYKFEAILCTGVYGEIFSVTRSNMHYTTKVFPINIVYSIPPW